MKTLSKLIITVTMICFYQQAMSQASVAFGGGHAWAPLRYDGWDVISAHALEIKHEGKYPIEFFTNAGGGGFANLRMWIKEDGNLTQTTDGRVNDGFVGIGDFFLAPATTPQELLHLRNSFPDVTVTYEQFTDGITNHTARDGFLVGINKAPNYLTAPVSIAKLTQQENGPMKFYTGTGSNRPSARMIINSDYKPVIHMVNQATDGYVGIGLPNFWDEESGTFPNSAEGPRSMLHLQGPYNAFNNGGDGWRKWMRTGVYINENSDEMYVGLKNEKDETGHTNRSDAVIMWGDDQANPDLHEADNFRLIFSGNNGDGNGTGTDPLSATTLEGREAVRVTPWGKMGVGPLFTWSTPPARRLELLDYQDGNQNQEPQLRLTYTQSTAANPTCTGIWTDFRTTKLGDLHILPTDADGGLTRRVGINWPVTVQPLGTLHLQTDDVNTIDLVLSRTAASNPYAWFETTALGDLGIFTATFGPYVQRNVGIQTATPGNTLEINSDATSITPGKSGLRFTDLTSSSNSAAPGIYTHFLTVDGSGDVVLADAPAGGGGVNVCASPTAPATTLLNYVSLFTNAAGTNICNSIVSQGTYSASTAIGVGYTSSVLSGKLDVDGDMNLSQTVATNHYKIFGQNVLHITPGTSSGQNLFVGAGTGDNNTGRDNTLVGDNLGSGTTALSGAYNSLFGSAAGAALTTGSYNSIGGAGAGIGLTTGSYNVLLGAASGAYLTTEDEEVMIGYQAGNGNKGINNTFVGYRTGVTTGGNSGFDNSMFGTEAGSQLSTGSWNTMMGMWAGYQNNAGDNNVYEGYQAGYSNIGNPAVGTDSLTGDNNVFVGYGTGQYTASQFLKNSTFLGYNANSYNSTSELDNAIAIGANTRVRCSDCMVLGSVSPSWNQVRVGIGYENPTASSTTTTGNYLLYVNSTGGTSATHSAFFNGDIYAASGFLASDSSLKSNIQPLAPNVASNIINQLHPKTYLFNQQGNPQLHLPSGPQCGLIAQEVEQLLPGLTTEITTPAILDSLGNIVNPELTFKGLNYTGIIPYIVQGIKEDHQRMDLQDQRMDSIENVNTQLAALIASCCNAGNRHSNPGDGGEQGNTSSIDVKLANTKGIILRQNQPNPFSEQTLITYNIPETVGKAQIFFYDNQGIILKTVDISEKGEGQLNVYASDLSSGSYTYSLIADGKLIETKKMLKTN